MKVDILSESPEDEAAVRIILDAILGRATESTGTKRNPPAGWGAVRQNLPPLMRAMHFNPAAAALVIVVDSDDSPIHSPEHDEPGSIAPRCRICLLRGDVKRIEQSLRPVANRAPLQTAIGLAVPAIEAWLLAETILTRLKPTSCRTRRRGSLE
ncbi:MAG TPA: hypothetical protein VJH03_02075 [Blastocatellia bacterium]|nr:hypothetical protein [Blastocatellia bacterium]